MKPRSQRDYPSGFGDLTQQGAQVRRRKRFAEQEALHLAAAFSAQDLELTLILHAFGGGGDAETIAQPDDRRTIA